MIENLVTTSEITGAVTGTLVTNYADNTKYSCPVHGITTKGNPYFGYAIDRTPHVIVTLYDKPRYHCLLCYAEWLEKNIPQLTEVKA